MSDRTDGSGACRGHGAALSAVAAATTAATCAIGAIWTAGANAAESG